MDLCEKWGNIGFDCNYISYQKQIDNVKQNLFACTVIYSYLFKNIYSLNSFVMIVNEPCADSNLFLTSCHFL